MLSCSSKDERGAKLYKVHCSSCHMLPDIQDLPKNLWEQSILPEMGARLGVQDSLFDPLKGHPYSEQYAIIKSGVYPKKSSISKQNWKVLKDYILKLAPDSLPLSPMTKNDKLANFNPKSVNIDSTNGAFISFLSYNKQNKRIFCGDINGNLVSYDHSTKEVKSLLQTKQAITDYSESTEGKIVTHVGYMNPSEIARGNIQIVNDSIKELPFTLHRPVANLVKDLNSDTIPEMVICEFGNLTGSLSLLSKRGTGGYEKTTLLNQPGATRVIARDMNGNGKEDLIVLMAQGDERVLIFEQNPNFTFNLRPVLQFNPLYGTSWFDLVDYDGDGDQDIITVHGDNADNTYIQKPYHGMRVYINEGNYKFSEKFFYPLNGATRFVAKDFDQDNDIDFAIISTFPDYERKPEFSFVYLENKNSEDFIFNTQISDISNLGRWLLIDSGDFDSDGDEDIVLGSFTYSFTPVPNNMLENWEQSNTDLLILENTLKP